jgi:hypothetical protein
MIHSRYENDTHPHKPLHGTKAEAHLNNLINKVELEGTYVCMYVCL